MLKRFLLLTILFLIPLVFGTDVSARVPKRTTYYIDSIKSSININRNRSISVTETIAVYFPEPRHGIFRYIPYRYKRDGKTISTATKVNSVTDDAGKDLPYKTSRDGSNLEIKIGDPDKTVTGFNTYVITYEVNNVVLDYEEHTELYWNLVGDKWDTDILVVSATVTSNFADITKVTCWAGYTGTTQQDCAGKLLSYQGAEFVSTNPISPGEDMSMVVGLSLQNSLTGPTAWEKFINTFLRYFGFVPAFLVPVLAFVLWYQKGRDKKYAGDNVYYQAENAREKAVPLFDRPHLPLVYYPINNLTPSQVGVLRDERVDMSDLVAEIIELARLGYIKLKKVEGKGLFGKDDYIFTRINKKGDTLKDYQMYLLEKLFLDKYVKDNKVRLSKLKNSFYKYLAEFKNKLYQNMKDEEYFLQNPGKVRNIWLVLGIFAGIVPLVLVFVLMTYSGMLLVPQLFLATVGLVVTILLAYNMPRKTPEGYSLYRQIKGLEFFIKKGKWRYEVSEKKLFLEEMLPLAIALGVVSELTRDMEDLKLEPPNYMAGFAAANLSSSINSFQTTTSKALATAPGGSRGSGFSGGSAGGGFGGGGGGSW